MLYLLTWFQTGFKRYCASNATYPSKIENVFLPLKIGTKVKGFMLTSELRFYPMTHHTSVCLPCFAYTPNGMKPWAQPWLHIRIVWIAFGKLQVHIKLISVSSILMEKKIQGDSNVQPRLKTIDLGIILSWLPKKGRVGGGLHCVESPLIMGRKHVL